VTDWIVETLISSSLLMALVLAVRRPVASAFGARTAYALWLLPLLRMVLPPLPGHAMLLKPFLAMTSVGGTTVQAGLASADALNDALILPPDVQSAFEAGPVSSGLGWIPVLVALWLAGAALFFGWQMLRYRLFVARALDGATHLSTSAGVQVFASDHVEGPIASGILQRRIFLPRDFLDRYSSSERRQALLHEGAHHDRKDLLANVAAIGMVALHWWNPLAHVAYRCFRADQELACDATVLADAQPDQLFAYGSALVKSTVGRTPAAACAFNRTQEIKQRLRMIKRGKLGLTRRLAGVGLAMGALVGGLLVTASGSATVHVEGDVPARAFLPVAAPVAPGEPAEPAAPSIRVDGRRVTFTAEPPELRPARLAAEQAREASEAARETARDLAEGARDASIDQAEAAREQAQAARDQAHASRIAARMVPDRGQIERMVAASLNQARASMAASCAARGYRVSASERDWDKLAMCDKAAFNTQVIRSMEQARGQIAQDRAMQRDHLDRALDALDAAIARMKARGIS